MLTLRHVKDYLQGKSGGIAREEVLTAFRRIEEICGLKCRFGLLLRDWSLAVALAFVMLMKRGKELSLVEAVRSFIWIGRFLMNEQNGCH